MRKLLSILIITVYSFGFSMNQNQTVPNEEKKYYSEIIDYLKKQNDGESYFYLHSFYINGSSTPDSSGVTIPKDTNLAEIYLKKSIELGFYHSAFVLGGYYLYHDDFMLKDDNISEAEKYLNLSVKNGIIEAYTTLGDLYLNFTGEAKKSIEAFTKGADGGVASSQYALAILYMKGVRGMEGDDFRLEPNEYISSKYITDACMNKNKTEKIERICNDSDLVIKEKE